MRRSLAIRRRGGENEAPARHGESVVSSPLTDAGLVVAAYDRSGFVSFTQFSVEIMGRPRHSVARFRDGIRPLPPTCRRQLRLYLGLEAWPPIGRRPTTP